MNPIVFAVIVDFNNHSANCRLRSPKKSAANRSGLWQTSGIFIILKNEEPDSATKLKNIFQARVKSRFSKPDGISSRWKKTFETGLVFILTLTASSVKTTKSALPSARSSLKKEFSQARMDRSSQSTKSNPIYPAASSWPAGDWIMKTAMNRPWICFAEKSKNHWVINSNWFPDRSFHPANPWRKSKPRIKSLSLRFWL